MALCIQDFLEFDYFKSLEVLAGADGLTGAVDSCGILDYELEQGLNKKYTDQNFHSGQLVLTSLLFAKNNPFLVRDAVKYVVSKGCSGLVVKNVFRLPIHESVLRYADSKKFPILLMNDSQMYFETFIIQVDKYLRMAENTEMVEWELTRLLCQPLNAGEKRECIHRLFPSFSDQYEAVYCSMTQPVSVNEFQKIRADLQTLGERKAFKCILSYQSGLFLVVSDTNVLLEQIEMCVDMIRNYRPDGSIGVSKAYYRMADIDAALREAMYAAKVHRFRKRQSSFEEKFLSYEQLGIYRVLLPLIEDEGLQRYSSDILDPILEFDAENRGNLLQTLLEFVQCGGSLHELSAWSGQHENTLRYRLDRIHSLTGLSYRRLGDYEQLALAARVYLLLQV